MNNKLTHALITCCLLFSLSSCEDDPKLPDNLVEFEAEVAGISEDEESLPININLSRETSSPVAVTVSVTSSTLQYGTDFTTAPEAVSNVISVVIPENESQATIVLTKVAGVGFVGDEQVVFSITSVDGPSVIGMVSQITVTFSEITVTNGEMNIQGGGPTYPNKVFIDLSANRQTAIDRTTWDFGFSSGTDFRVILNSSNGMMARGLDETDLNAVTAADTVGFGEQLSVSAVFAAINMDPTPDWVPTAITWIDDPTGNLANTAIASVSATESENKVYIVNKGDGPGTPATKLGWKKIRILRNGTGYTLQHADIAATTFSEIQITKDTEFAFQYVSMATGAVDVEPATDRWDLAWTGFTNAFNFVTGPVPYYFQDIILQNTAGVQTVQILNTVKEYEEFTEADVATLDFGVQSQVKIGSSWRNGGGPGGPPSLKTDRFYVIKDADENVYKLKFTALTQEGERGRPAIEFALLQAGE